MSISELQEQNAAAKAELLHLKEQLQRRRRDLADIDVATYASASGKSVIDHDLFSREFKCVRTLQGHTGKIYSLDWSVRERNRIVSASGDGRLIVWNALTSQKTHAIRLLCAWVMACAFSPGGERVACGGLDNCCSIFNLNATPDRDGNLPVSRVLTGHKGYLSCCRFVPDQAAHIITSSGDQTCMLWDVEAHQRIATFGGDAGPGHTGDVLSVSVSSYNSRIFVSGSCDTTARLWDTRIASAATHTFHGHTQDVNAVQFLPDGLNFGTGSDDGTCRIFDTRTVHELQIYSDPYANGEVRAPGQVACIAFSHSGRLLFAGYSNGACLVWDAIMAQPIYDLGSWHGNRVSCLGLSSDGTALCTGSWDSFLKVWSYSRGRQ